MTNEELKKLLTPDAPSVRKCERCGQDIEVKWESMITHITMHAREDMRKEVEEATKNAEPIQSLKDLLNSKV
jgi:hypothetical protein